MTKQILIPSAILLASGCTTSMEDYASDEVSGAEAATKNIEEEFGYSAEEIQAMLDPIIASFDAEALAGELVELSYAMPLLPGMESSDTALCGEAPSPMDDLHVLDSNVRELQNRWGWEIAVTDCAIGDEIFSGVMRISYEEMLGLPSFLREGHVVDSAFQALHNNYDGVSSLQYGLDVVSAERGVHVMGSVFGPAEFVSAQKRVHILNFADDNLQSLDSNEMGHEMDPGIGVIGGTGEESLINRDFNYETRNDGISLETGDTSRVHSQGVALRPGDAWPHFGSVDAHQEAPGSEPVRLRFNEQTPVDGSADLLTPYGRIRVSLPMN